MSSSDGDWTSVIDRPIVAQGPGGVEATGARGRPAIVHGMLRKAPAAERNRGPIIEVLREHLRPGMRVLEVASGTGQHVVAFAEAFPEVTFAPSDADPDARSSVLAWLQQTGRTNVRAPIPLDATLAPWPGEETKADAPAPYDVVICINMIHIAPWEATLGLVRGAAAVTGSEGCLYLYGPFHLDGRPTAPSNAAFDQSLRARDPSWGVRDLGEVQREAARFGWELHDRVSMPANNFSLIFRKRPPTAGSEAEIAGRTGANDGS